MSRSYHKVRYVITTKHNDGLAFIKEHGIQGARVVTTVEQLRGIELYSGTYVILTSGDEAFVELARFTNTRVRGVVR